MVTIDRDMESGGFDRDRETYGAGHQVSEQRNEILNQTYSRRRIQNWDSHNIPQPKGVVPRIGQKTEIILIGDSYLAGIRYLENRPERDVRTISVAEGNIYLTNRGGIIFPKEKEHKLILTEKVPIEIKLALERISMQPLEKK